MGCLKLNTSEENGVIKYMNAQIDTENKINGTYDDNILHTDNTENKQNLANIGCTKEQHHLNDRLSFILQGCLTLFSIIGAIAACFVFFDNRFGKIESRFNEVDKALAERLTSGDLSEINDDVNTMHDYLYNDEGVQDQLGDIASDITEIKDLLNITSIIASPDVTSVLDKISIEPNDNSMSYASFTATTCIGTDAEGKEYIAKDLIDEKVLLTYTENDKEVYFLGEYNENYHWDGYCITNVYNSDSTLYGICEYNFDDGKRLDYKSFCVSESNNKEWIYSDKKCNENSNSGKNILYSFDYDKKKNFTNTNVRISDIIYVDDFVESIKPTVLTYYSGNTSDGKYNDDTGDAYEIIYNDDGTIKTLYVGNFKDGTFNDATGNAWDIAYSDEGGYYVYNEGEFKDGRAVKRSATPIDTDRINEIILEHKQKFDIELKWKQN